MSRTYRQLCLDPACRTHTHHPTCTNEQCRGCQPAQAADGLNLCPHHTNRLTENALQAATNHRDLAAVLTSSGLAGEKVAGGEDQGLNLNEAAVQARQQIRTELEFLARIITEERGHHLPATGHPDRADGHHHTVDTSIPTLARLIARNSEWLAARDTAGDTSATLHELARGLPYRIANPTRSRRFPIKLPSGVYAECPDTVIDEDDQHPCPGTLWTILRTDISLQPAEIICNHDDNHRWASSDWLRLGRQLTTTTRAAA